MILECDSEPDVVVVIGRAVVVTVARWIVVAVVVVIATAISTRIARIGGFQLIPLFCFYSFM